MYGRALKSTSDNKGTRKVKETNLWSPSIFKNCIKVNFMISKWLALLEMGLYKLPS